MTGGAKMSARETERAGVAGLACRARALLGRTGATECERGREHANGPRGWAEPEREGGVGPR
jgi:hypothetical protein